VDLPQALKAGELKRSTRFLTLIASRLPLPYSHRATLVTGDRDFRETRRHFPVLWIARPELPKGWVLEFSAMPKLSGFRSRPQDQTHHFRR